MLPSHPDADAPECEKKVFAAFERQLPKDWTVFHSRRIVLPRLARWSSASSTSSSSILPGEHAGSSEQHLYVAASRARHVLAVLGYAALA